ncbi:MAG: type 2 isopentenyl-diphosphate Delta-isomerase [Verrucomicrobia bacterium]|nr:type 2 isopentenyl-diphosphate Delta-isomerase [Verrucomicrobiota bacterium]
MSDRINDRKLAHIRVIQEDAASDRERSHFDRLRMTHRALPELNLAEIDTGSSFLGKRLAFPLLISCMTGGDHDMLRTVNRNLATAAERCGVAMGVGSQRVMFASPGARDSFALREFAPSALLFGNIGAVQLNNGFTIAMCRDAVAVLGADALCLHLNPLQEAVQPEGETNFGGLAERIGSVAAQLGHPVIVKEVGAGISRADADLLLAQGVEILDVAGAGGTSWSRIEAQRQAAGDGRSLGELFQDWGTPTPAALLALEPLRERVTLIASGGIRNGVDMAKAMVLGASLCGVARPLLAPAMESVDAVVAVIARLEREFRTAMFLMGVGSTAALIGNHGLIAGMPAAGDWA